VIRSCYKRLLLEPTLRWPTALWLLDRIGPLCSAHTHVLTTRRVLDYRHSSSACRAGMAKPNFSTKVIASSAIDYLKLSLRRILQSLTHCSNVGLSNSLDLPLAVGPWWSADLPPPPNRACQSSLTIALQEPKDRKFLASLFLRTARSPRTFARHHTTQSRASLTLCSTKLLPHITPDSHTQLLLQTLFLTSLWCDPNKQATLDLCMR